MRATVEKREDKDAKAELWYLLELRLAAIDKVR